MAASREPARRAIWLRQSCNYPRRERKVDRTIKMPEAAADSFDISVDYMYSRKLDVTLLSLDNPFAAYFLADYVDCPAFTDAVLEEIHARRACAVTPYTAEQIHFVLTNTLSDQSLRIFPARPSRPPHPEGQIQIRQQRRPRSFTANNGRSNVRRGQGRQRDSGARHALHQPADPALSKTRRSPRAKFEGGLGYPSAYEVVQGR
jgi:hypothetical protein